MGAGWSGDLWLGMGELVAVDFGAGVDLEVEVDFGAGVAPPVALGMGQTCPLKIFGGRDEGRGRKAGRDGERNLINVKDDE